MKKLLIIFIFTFSFTYSFAEDSIRYYFATEFAMKIVDNNREDLGEWSDWEESGVPIIFNITKDIVEICSPKSQIYNITKYCGLTIEDDNSRIAKFNFINNEGYHGNMELRLCENGKSELYIVFANVMWVYNVIKVY